jgi:hypothetical protein
MSKGSTRRSAETVSEPMQSMVCPLFAEISPVVLAEDVSEIKVYRAVTRGGQMRRGAVVDFEEEEYIEANDGEIFVVIPDETNDLILTRILKKVKPGMYFAQGYDRKGGVIQRAMRTIDATIDKNDEEEEDEEEDGVTGQVIDPNSGGNSAVLFKEFMGFIREKERAASREVPNAISMATQLAQAITTKEDPNAIVADLRDTLKSERTRFEMELVEARRKASVEIDTARLDFRRELDARDDRHRRSEEQFYRDREAWSAERRSMIEHHTNELRSMRDAHAREMSEFRVRSDNQITQLQTQLLTLQHKSNHELLTTERQLMMTELDKQLAANAHQDAQHAIKRMEQDSEQMMKQLAAAGSNGAVGQIAQLASAAPAIKDIVSMIFSKNSDGSNKPVDTKSLITMIQANPSILADLQKDPAMLKQVQELVNSLSPQQQQQTQPTQQTQTQQTQTQTQSGPSTAGQWRGSPPAEEEGEEQEEENDEDEDDDGDDDENEGDDVVIGGNR